MQLEECWNFLLTRAQQAVFQNFKKELEPLNITPVQYGVLKCLLRENGCTVKNLSARLGLDSSTLSGVLDRMEQKELIKRVTDKYDRRALMIFITQKGKDLKIPFEKAIAKAEEEVSKKFSDQETALLKNLLKEIYQGEREEEQA